MLFARSTDGGDTWTTRQLSAATNNSQTGGRQGCAIRTDSARRRLRGVDRHRHPHPPGRLLPGPLLQRRPDLRATPGLVQGSAESGSSTRRRAGSPSTASPAPGPTPSRRSTSPTARRPATDATDQILLTWSDDSPGTNLEKAFLVSSTNGGGTYSAKVVVSEGSDRANFPAVAISPDGTDAWLVYNAWLDPWRNDTTSPRRVLGVVRHADINADDRHDRRVDHSAAWRSRRRPRLQRQRPHLGVPRRLQLRRRHPGLRLGGLERHAQRSRLPRHQRLPPGVRRGRPRRGTTNPIVGDRQGGPSRGRRTAGHALDALRPDPNNDCPPTFGNSDIFGGTFSDDS